MERSMIGPSKVTPLRGGEAAAPRIPPHNYEAAGTLIQRGQIANFLTLKNMFDQDPGLAEAGGAQYLARLTAAVVTIINAEDYGRTVHDLFLRRELINIGAETGNDASPH